MGETSLNLVGGGPGGGSAPQAITFLCHNSADKLFVKQIADALEIEFGTRYFLDAYAIPTGEAFLPWIEQSLAGAAGIAIFLGSNGWGPTHLWEAERALARYRADPTFKLIPVALPGINGENMRRLGAGKVFQDINWADFTKGPRDLDSLRKLEAALSGRKLPQYQGPSRLTPYQVRRDAMRWTDARRKDRSILYKGAQLDQAFDLVQRNPDYVVADEVLPFLDAARAHQRRFWQRVAGAGLSTAAALTALSIAIYLNYSLAERRRIASLSRQLAIASREAPGADRRLLIATRAVLTDRTAEAKGALLESLEEWRHLRRITHLGAGVNALATEPDGSAVLVGAEGGSVRSVADGIAREVLAPRPSEGSTTALALAGSLYVGRESGRVEALAGPSPHTLLAPPQNPPLQRDLAIRCLAAKPDGSMVAAASGSGRLALVETSSGRVVRDLDEGEAVAFRALAFTPDGERLMAGTSLGELIVLDARTGDERQRYPRLDGGVLAAAFGAGGELRVVTGYGALVTFHEEGGEFRRIKSHHLGSLLTSAAFDRSGSRMATGDASGSVRVLDGDGEPTGFDRTGAHASPISALLFAADGTLHSGSSDGTLATWDLSSESGPSRPVPGLGPTVDVLRTRQDGTLVAALATKGRAEAWRLDAERWVMELDLLSTTREILGPAALRATDGDPPSPGFESMDAEVPTIAMDGLGTRIVWTTASGAVIWQDLSRGRPNVIAPGSDGASEVGLSRDGRWLAVLAAGRRQVEIVELDAAGSSRWSTPLPAPGRSLAFDPGGSRLVVGLENGRVAVLRSSQNWRADAQTVPRHDSGVAGIGFTTDGAKLVTFGSGGGGSDRSVVVTDAESSTPPRRLQSRLAGGSVAAMAVGTSTGLLAAADQDGMVWLWDLADLRFMAVLKAGTTSVPALRLDTESGAMITYSSDGSFRSWDLNVGSWVMLACRKANRDLRPDEWAELLPDDAMVPTCER
ncbi:TIR domain-containing protein [Methylobacterium sp. V23]|uniref:toll/interleukin-1 receptor domain-containing protein n=1 Tax=Methylobacterium sp. V23 TaxID=2044878 RepID=UPI000CDB15DC|nr:TIR domain-containing protein [Methylobacterium sp. V23]POR40062.1 pyrrolo-quinoline quinone [Methylobacterium sp. V23]